MFNTLGHHHGRFEDRARALDQRSQDLPDLRCARHAHGQHRRATRQNRPNWSEIVDRLVRPEQGRHPIDEIYAPQETVQQSNQQGTQEMVDSQQQATAAALYELGITFTSDGDRRTGPRRARRRPAFCKKGDILKTFNGKTFVDADQLHSSSSTNGTSKAATIAFTRKGVCTSAQVTPEVDQAGPVPRRLPRRELQLPVPGQSAAAGCRWPECRHDVRPRHHRQAHPRRAQRRQARRRNGNHHAPTAWSAPSAASGRRCTARARPEPPTSSRPRATATRSRGHIPSGLHGVRDLDPEAVGRPT